MEDAIIALATPQARSALAIIRLSGRNCFEIIQKCIIESDKFEKAPVRHIFLYTFIDEKEQFIDEITAIKYATPESFTGEDAVEIICHGSPLIIEEIVNECLKKGARAANKGEFSRRAFINGKLELMKAESINGIIESTTFIEMMNARNQYKGKHDDVIRKIKKQVIEILSDIETQIEFNEEDDIKAYKSEIKKKNEAIINIINEEIKKSEEIEKVIKGIKIIIAGPPNAGKSTLFNYLIDENRAIIYETPGTTRDLLTERIRIHDKEAQITDSAGIRETINEIEGIGIKKAKEEIEKAHIVLWVSSANEELFKEEEDLVRKIINEKKILFIINKVDIIRNSKKNHFLQAHNIRYVEASIKEKKNMEEIRAFIESSIQEIYNSIEIPDIIQNSRQKEIVKKVNELLSEINKEKNEEIIAYHLNDVLRNIEELTGRVSSEEILNNIFSNFCIGK